MRYRLRTLLIVLALGPPVLAGIWLFAWRQESSSVRGRVTLRGMPAASVTLTFVPPSGKGASYAAQTDAAGCYRVIGDSRGRAVKPGSYRVSFTATSLPAQYQSPATSPIVVTVSGPENQIDFDLQ
jgi:hypothetical protein